MLPEIRLDTDDFEEIVRKARSRIPGICPEWTDYNCHDPGITLLELFAFLNEAQQFYLDQTDDGLRKKLLSILGIAPKRRTPARVAAAVRILEPSKRPYVRLRPGTRFTVGETCFETELEENLPGPVLRCAIVRAAGEAVYRITGERLSSLSRAVRLYPFGRKTREGNEWLLCLKYPLEAGVLWRLSLTFFDGYEVRRNPWEPGERFTPLSEVELLSWGKDGYRKVAMEDGTRGFLADGRICFRLDQEMEEREEEGERGYFLKFCLIRDSFDVSPAVTAADFNRIGLVQRKREISFLPVRELPEGQEAVFYRKGPGNYYIECERKEADMASVCGGDFCARRVLAEGTGFPNQRCGLGIKGAQADSVILFTASLEKKGWFRRWSLVENFDASGPEDCHFTMDEDSGIIAFGDGVRGRMPETQIRIVSLAVQRDGLGNITSGRELMCAFSGEEGQRLLTAVTVADGTGGRGPETAAQAFKRARELLGRPDRAVTAADYEALVRRTPGLMIEDCQVVREEGDARQGNQIGIAVRPFAEGGYGRLSESYRKNILDFLDGRRLLGSYVRLYSPEYIETEVYAEISAGPRYPEAGRAVEENIRRFFQALSGFGRIVSYGSLFAAVDGMEEVRQIHMLSVNARGSRISRTKNGDVLLPPMGVLILTRAECAVINR